MIHNAKSYIEFKKDSSRKQSTYITLNATQRKQKQDEKEHLYEHPYLHRRTNHTIRKHRRELAALSESRALQNRTEISASGAGTRTSRENPGTGTGERMMRGMTTVMQVRKSDDSVACPASDHGISRKEGVAAYLTKVKWKRPGSSAALAQWRMDIRKELLRDGWYCYFSGKS
ncbi:hypothetical protein NPIL_567921 [Nephila pilipes]|uniref:Uncharacterized protein n=1 Tax=Nephila pilipes TaxID=299642 RepID=A0A8X6PMW0_NEPPI|nr:hypothetical protein NPIL_567921 [Nephila pilipes]